MRSLNVGGRVQRRVWLCVTILLLASVVTVLVLPSAKVSGVVLVKAAGEPYTDARGRLWSTEHEWIGDNGGEYGGAGQDILATDEDALYRSHRWGMQGINLGLPEAGSYRVRLLFSETVMTASGKRIFDVLAEGRVVVANLDVFSKAGFATAHDEIFEVGIRGRILQLRFNSVVDAPMISAVELTKIERGDDHIASLSTTTVPAGTTTSVPEAVTTTTDAPTTTSTPQRSTTTTPSRPAAPNGKGFPGPENTGVPAGTTLKPSGTIFTTHDGQVIDGMDVTGSIQVQHDNVTIKRTRIRRPGGNAIKIDGNKNLLIEDCELDGTGNPDAASAIAEHNYTMRRCDVHHFGEGPRINGNVTLEDNFVHDFVDYVSMGAHQDTVQITSGSNIVIRHNTMLMNVDGANGGIYTCCYGGDNLLIEGNLLAGGLWATTGGGDIDGHALYTNVTIRNNRFSSMYYPGGGYFGPMSYTTHDTLSGNVWHETGRPL